MHRLKSLCKTLDLILNICKSGPIKLVTYFSFVFCKSEMGQGFWEMLYHKHSYVSSSMKLDNNNNIYGSEYNNITNNETFLFLNTIRNKLHLLFIFGRFRLFRLFLIERGFSS